MLDAANSPDYSGLLSGLFGDSFWLSSLSCGSFSMYIFPCIFYIQNDQKTLL